MMTITGKNTIQLNDILIGEVWLVAGQSNMQRLLRETANGDAVQAGANHPDIRLFNVRREVGFKKRQANHRRVGRLHAAVGRRIFRRGLLLCSGAAERIESSDRYDQCFMGRFPGRGMDAGRVSEFISRSKADS